VEAAMKGRTPGAEKLRHVLRGHAQLDSYRYHNTRHAWERDRRREREAYARGDQSGDSPMAT
jgi:hypothetical protein